jgi:hypothetical protein
VRIFAKPAIHIRPFDKLRANGAAAHGADIAAARAKASAAAALTITLPPP